MRKNILAVIKKISSKEIVFTSPVWCSPSIVLQVEIDVINYLKGELAKIDVLLGANLKNNEYVCEDFF